MYNAINRLLAVLIPLLCVACGNSDSDRANALLQESTTALESHNYPRAIELLDTLNTRYPDRTAQRRQGLLLRARAIEGMAIDSISSADAALAQATLTLQDMENRFRPVESSVGLEGYYLPEGVSEKVMGATGIQGRVTLNGLFYIVANVQGRQIGLRAIELAEGSDIVTSNEISPARIIKVEGSETASFSPEDVEPIGPWLTEHPGADKLILLGSKSNLSLKLTPALRTQLTDCYLYSRAIRDKRLASLRREKYERMLATARDQIANFTPSPGN